MQRLTHDPTKRSLLHPPSLSLFASLSFFSVTTNALSLSIFPSSMCTATRYVHIETTLQYFFTRVYSTNSIPLPLCLCALSLSLSLSLANPSNKLHKHTHTGGGGGKKAGKLFGRGENFFTLCVVWRVSSVQLSQLHFLLTPDESSRVIEEQVCSKNSLDHHFDYFDHHCVSLIPPQTSIMKRQFLWLHFALIIIIGKLVLNINNRNYYANWVLWIIDFLLLLKLHNSFQHISYVGKTPHRLDG